MKIKASSINNLTDARYFAAWNIEWLGFSLEPGNSNHTRPQDVKEIKDWLVGPKIVGEFGMGQTATEINEAVEMLNLDAVQLSMFADSSVATKIQKVPVFKEWVLQDLGELSVFEEACAVLATKNIHYFILDLSKNNIDWASLTANKAALQTLQEICQEYPILLNISCPPSSIESMINTIQPHGLSIEGGEEEKVGVKSFDDLDELFEQLEELNLIGY